MNFNKHISQNSKPDEALLTAYRQNNDLNSLGILYNRYMDLVFGVCMKYLKNPHESEDATMSIFEVLVKKLQTHQVDNFKSWLYVLTKNHCLQILRKRKRSLTETYDPQDMHSSTLAHHDDEFEIADLSNGMADCLDALPAKQKKCIRLLYYESKSYQEIADLMVVKKDKVRSYIQNGRRNLKLCMEKKKHANKRIT